MLAVIESIPVWIGGVRWPTGIWIAAVIELTTGSTVAALVAAEKTGPGVPRPGYLLPRESERASFGTRAG
jgi:hypothetical protein